MIVARDAEGAREIAITGRQFEAGAGRLLADGVAVKLLPWRLVLRILEATSGHQVGMAFLHFCVGDQDIRRALAEIDADADGNPDAITSVSITGPWWSWDLEAGVPAADNGDGTWTIVWEGAPEEDMEYLWL